MIKTDKIEWIKMLEGGADCESTSEIKETET